MPRVTRIAVVFLAFSACNRLSDSQAEQLVRDYNAKVIEAYRTADPQLASSVVGTAEFKKLTGLIGARQDADLVLDSELQSFSLISITREGESVTVLTQERWFYKDRKIGSGQQVGDESTDDYEMRYVLAKENGRWVVERIEWATPPKVGRTTAPMTVDVEHTKLAPSAYPTAAAPSVSPDAGAVP